MRGERALTQREEIVFRSVYAGHTYPEIAAEFGTSELNIKQTMRHVFDKLGACNRIEAVVLALRKELLPSRRPKMWDVPARPHRPWPRGGSGRYVAQIACLLVALAMTKSAAAQMSGAAFQSGPTPPQVLMFSNITAANFPDLFPAAVNKTVKASGGDYTTCQQAFDDIHNVAPSCSEIITVDAGYSCATLGDGVWLYYHITCPALAHVWLRSANYALLPPQDNGKKTCPGYPDPMPLCPSDQANMFDIVKTTTSSAYDLPFVICSPGIGSPCPTGGGATGASGLIVTGANIEITPPAWPLGEDYGIAIGYYTDTGAQYAHNIWLDRIWIDTTNGYAGQFLNGVSMQGNNISLSDSVIDHVNLQNRTISLGTYGESHGILTYNGNGAIKVVNTSLLGTSTENFLAGGNPPSAGNQTMNIEFRTSTLYKDPTQMAPTSLLLGSSCTSDPNCCTTGVAGHFMFVKDHFEDKGAGTNVLVNANLMQNSYSDATCGGQDGNFTLLQPTQNGSCPECQLRNVTYSHNIHQHAASMLQTTGHNFATPWIQWPVTDFIDIIGNLYQDVNWNTYSAQYTSGFSIASDGVGATFGPGPYHLRIEYNGIYATPSNSTQLTYINEPLGCSTPGTVIPAMTLAFNVAVTDATQLGADCGATFATMYANGVFPNFNTGISNAENVFFNYTHGTCTGTVCPCANFGSFNIGWCPVGTAADTGGVIESTLGISNYATCSAGNSLSTVPCVIGGTIYTGLGPDYAGMAADMAASNDTLQWGARTRF